MAPGPAAIGKEDPLQGSNLAKRHLESEQEDYAAFSALVPGRLLGSFLNVQRAIEVRIEVLLSESVSGEPDESNVAPLFEGLDQLIHLEETVLFPLVLSQLAQQGSRTAG